MVSFVSPQNTFLGVLKGSVPVLLLFMIFIMTSIDLFPVAI